MEVLEYKCPCCSARIVFDSNAQKLVCSSCGNTFDVDILKEYEETMNASEKWGDGDWGNVDAGYVDWQEGEKENIVISICPSCAGEIIGDRNTAATECPYCGNTAIITKQFAGGLKPNYIIPFKIDKKQVTSLLTEYCKTKRLLPKLFLDKIKKGEFVSLYVPFWLIGCDTSSRLSFDGTKVRVWSDSDYDYVKTDYYLIKMAGDICFEKIPVDASIKMRDELMESIEPFDYKDIVDFSPAYLSGYLADRYDEDKEESKKKANYRINNSVEELFAGAAPGYDSLSLQSVDIDIKNEVINYILLPIWMMNIKYKEKVYTLAMNGQTGTVAGELPYSKVKFFGYFFAVFVGLSILIIALIIYLWS